MKIKNKGKIYPSPSPSTSSTSFVAAAAASSTKERDVLSVLNLLPTAVLALASILSLEDREVLAYMITRSLKSTATTAAATNPLKSSKKPLANHKKTPIFDCDCFDCYTSYWFRWDSSSNRELIHQVIEAFEDHLNNGEQLKKHARGGKRSRDKLARKTVETPGPPENPVPAPPEADDLSSFSISSDEGVAPLGNISPERAADGKGTEGEAGGVSMEEVAEETEAVATWTQPIGSGHKGLARKVLPDVLGLLNSRLWNLWSPTV